jgi:cyclic pyranopterin phosphate synthase
MVEISHTDEDGNARMVNISEKPITQRRAVAEGRIQLTEQSLTAIVERRAKKGDVLSISQLAAIQGAKRVSDLIPLCHPIPITRVDVVFDVEKPTRTIRCEATVCAQWRTGVEMEALVAVTTGLMTIYDMLKGLDKSMEISGVRLLEKSGGQSGDWVFDQAGG